MHEVSATPRPLRVLLLLQEPRLRETIRAALLRSADIAWELVELDQIALARRTLEQESFDLVVLDTLVDDIRWVSEHAEGTAMVYVTKDRDAIPWEEIFAAGATECLTPDQVEATSDLLPITFRQVVRSHSAERNLAYLNGVLHQRGKEVVRLTQRLLSSPIDVRAGWRERRKILDRLEEEIQRAKRYGINFSIVLAEFDGLDSIERQHGHDLADSVLTSLAERMLPMVRPTDLVGHYGSAEILVLLTNTDGAGASSFCRRVNDRFEQTVSVDGEDFRVRCVFGYAEHNPRAEVTMTDLIRQAEESLIQARSAS